MREAFVNINDVPTHIMTWGKWIEESFDPNEREVIICITGNPGLPAFYTQFLSTLYNHLDSSIPVWLIGHAGHDEPPSTSLHKVPALSGNETKFSLNGQIKHKIEFIETYVPPNVRIHLIGHSIACWMILEMLKESRIKQRIQKCYLLFPTIERMADAPNGRFITGYFLPAFFIVRLLLRFVDILPVFLKIVLIYIYFFIVSFPKHYLGTVLKFIQPSIIDCVVFLVREEMERVRDLEVDIVRDNKNLLKFFYGATDGWVPITYYDELKVRVPGVDAILSDENVSHTFVLRESVLMGRKVADWIAEARN